MQQPQLSTSPPPSGGHLSWFPGRVCARNQISLMSCLWAFPVAQTNCSISQLNRRSSQKDKSVITPQNFPVPSSQTASPEATMELSTAPTEALILSQAASNGVKMCHCSRHHLGLLKVIDLGFQQGDLLSPTPPVTPTIYYPTDWDLLSNFLCQCSRQFVPLSLVQVCLQSILPMVRNGQKENQLASGAVQSVHGLTFVI